MDIERMKKLLNSGIEAGNKVKAVREVIKTYKTQKQDIYDDTTEILKPSIDAQKEVKESIDKKQDKVIKELQKNQQVIKSGLEDIAMMNLLPELPAPIETTKLPIDYKPIMMDDIDGKPEKKSPYKSNIDKGFTLDEMQKLTDYELPPPSQVLKSHIDGSIDIDKFDRGIGKKIKKLAGQKGYLSKTKKTRDKNKKEIDGLTENIKLLQKYRQRIDVIEGAKTLGEGIYTQKKRNAYKISQKGQYGGLVIDLPKLYGHLKVVAHKNGQKVYDTQADFDTLDLLTKRFNSKKNYSELARSILNDLNRLSQIPIHRTSKKYSKLGSGVVYYNNPQDLLSRLELLGGSMSAGNNSIDVREEFVKIVHMLNKLNVIPCKN